MVKVRILDKKELPSLNETIYLIHLAENKSILILESQSVESSAMITKMNRGTTKAAGLEFTSKKSK